MRIVLDAMGSDTCPDPEIEAALEATSLFNDPIILVGPEELLKNKLASKGGKNQQVVIVNAPETITMQDKGLQVALKVKRKGSLTSMAVGVDLISLGEADAFVTAGNTGGAVATSYFRLGMIQGVELPGLTPLFPVRGGLCVVLDIGANPDCKPENLHQFAIMGSVYAQKVRQVSNPRIGLLSNGEEAGKGNELIRNTFPLLEKSGLNFIGNVESKELFNGEVDVLVTDGFSGNILLKTSEAVAKFIIEVMSEQIKSSTMSKIGGLLARQKLRKVKDYINPDEIGAAPLLGINGLVLIAHGRSNSHALVSAIRTARQAVSVNLLVEIQHSIQEQIATKV
jgi:phosphate acyltransferase